MRKLFQIMVYDKLYWVWSIDGKDHNYDNGEQKNWWLYYAEEELPEGVTPAIDSPNWHQYSKGMNRLNFDIRVKQRTTSKYKWEETRFSNHTFTEICCNGRVIYSFPSTGGRDGLSYSFAKAQQLIVQIFEHPFDFLNPEKEHGRKIFFYGMPATVRVWRHDTPWEIGIDPCYDEVTKEEWWKEYRRRKSTFTPSNSEWDEIDEDHDNDNENSGWINWGDALSDGHINWFRN